MEVSTHPGSQMEPRAWTSKATLSSLTSPLCTYVSHQPPWLSISTRPAQSLCFAHGVKHPAHTDDRPLVRPLLLLEFNWLCNTYFSLHFVG